MADIIITAAPYCYGPTSKALCLAGELQTRHRVTYIGGEPGLSLAKAASLDSVIALADRDHWSDVALDALTRSAVVISSLDSRAIRIAASYGVPSVFFDTLLWLRTEMPAFSELAQSYVAQTFFRAPARAITHDCDSIAMVGPVFSRSLDTLLATKKHPGGRILVNFGGLTSPAMLQLADVRYIIWIASVLQRTTIASDQMIVCLPIHLHDLKEMVKSYLPSANITTPSMDEFHDLLCNSLVVVTIPGLESVLEAIYLRKPLVFLPPHNGTQLIQLREYTRAGIGDCVPLPEAVRDLDDSCRDLHKLTKSVQLGNQEGATDNGLGVRLASYVRDSVCSLHRASRVESVVARNAQFLETLGVGGRLAAVDLVEYFC